MPKQEMIERYGLATVFAFQTLDIRQQGEEQSAKCKVELKACRGCTVQNCDIVDFQSCTKW